MLPKGSMIIKNALVISMNIMKFSTYLVFIKGGLVVKLKVGVTILMPDEAPIFLGGREAGV